MDILRKELNSIYQAQQLDSATLPAQELKADCTKVAAISAVTGRCAVVTDVAADRSHLFPGSAGRIIGLADSPTDKAITLASTDEDDLYLRLDPDDLAQKRLLEYEFFKFIDSLTPDHKLDYKATCRLRIRCHDDKIRYFDNTTRMLRLAPSGKFWLILCQYELSTNLTPSPDIDPCIINLLTADTFIPDIATRRQSLLSPREKEVLGLIRDGLLSKEIASMLSISINTVNRHRQNILDKLSVDNSIEAIAAATQMKLI